MKVGRSYKQEAIGGPYDAIVIGSGIGGMTTAAMLALRAHKRVLVLERHYVAGGYTHVFRRPGYEWDVGLHYVGELGQDTICDRLFTEVTAGQLEWADLGETYDRVVVGKDAYDLVRGKERFRDTLVRSFPGQARALDRYLEALSAANRWRRIYFAEKAVPGPVAAAFGGLMRRPTLRWARRTTLEVLRELTDDPRLIAVLTGQWGTYGLPPGQSSFFAHALIASHYLEGGYFPVGGSSRIAETIEPAIAKAGGAVVTCAEVDRVLVHKGRAVGVRMADGAEINAPVVVSGVGVANTFGRLLPSQQEVQPLVERWRALGPSIAHVSLYVGMARSSEELRLPAYNLWLYPDEDHDRTWARVAGEPDVFPLIFISFPSAKDPAFGQRHPGHSTAEVLALMPWERVARWQETRWMKRGADYQAFKESLRARLLRALTEHFPHVEPFVDHAEVSTPLSTRHFTSHPSGEMYGLAPTPTRFEAQWLRPSTPIRGLFLTGSDVMIGGVGGSMLAGALTASAVLGRPLLGNPFVAEKI